MPPAAIQWCTEKPAKLASPEIIAPVLIPSRTFSNRQLPMANGPASVRLSPASYSSTQAASKLAIAPLRHTRLSGCGWTQPASHPRDDACQQHRAAQPGSLAERDPSRRNRAIRAIPLVAFRVPHIVQDHARRVQQHGRPHKAEELGHRLQRRVGDQEPHGHIRDRGKYVRDAEQTEVVEQACGRRSIYLRDLGSQVWSFHAVAISHGCGVPPPGSLATRRPSGQRPRW